jgi:hypothetical protein
VKKLHIALLNWRASREIRIRSGFEAHFSFQVCTVCVLLRLDRAAETFFECERKTVSSLRFVQGLIRFKDGDLNSVAFFVSKMHIARSSG